MVEQDWDSQGSYQPASPANTRFGSRLLWAMLPLMRAGYCSLQMSDSPSLRLEWCPPRPCFFTALISCGKPKSRCSRLAKLWPHTLSLATRKTESHDWTYLASVVEYHKVENFPDIGRSFRGWTAKEMTYGQKRTNYVLIYSIWLFLPIIHNCSTVCIQYSLSTSL